MGTPGRQSPFSTPVPDTYLKFAKGNSREENVALRPAADGEEIPPLAAVVKVKDSPWTIILRTIFDVRSPDLKHVAGAVKELSKSLKTRAFSYAGTEESENGECELFDSGKSLATADDDDSIFPAAHAENILLPACYPTRDGDKSWLAIEKPSIPMVDLLADPIARRAAEQSSSQRWAVSEAIRQGGIGIAPSSTVAVCSGISATGITQNSGPSDARQLILIDSAASHLSWTA